MNRFMKLIVLLVSITVFIQIIGSVSQKGVFAENDLSQPETTQSTIDNNQSQDNDANLEIASEPTSTSLSSDSSNIDAIQVNDADNESNANEIVQIAAYVDANGQIEAENYSSMSGVATETCSDVGGGLDVGYIHTGDWMNYDINVLETGRYTIDFRIASAWTTGKIQILESDGAVLGSINVPNTRGWQSWQTISTVISLEEGNQTLKLYASDTGWNINWLSFTYAGDITYQSISSLIEAESYRSLRGVVTETCTDTGGGLNVAGIHTGDWMKYDINVPAAGSYSIDLRIATAWSTGQIQIQNSHGTVISTINVPNTGGWQIWQTISTDIYLSEGNQSIKLYASGSGWNINYMNFVQLTGELTIKGYIKPYIKMSHLTSEAAVPVPLDDFMVKIMDDEEGSATNIATVYTNSDGYFETTVVNDLSENGLDIFLRLELDDDITTIKSGLFGSIYVWDSTISYDITSETLNYGVISPATSTTEEIEGAFSIWYWISKGHAYYMQNSYNGTTLPQIIVYWQKGEASGSYYDWLGAIRIAGENETGDAECGDQYDPIIILHEYGHFIMDKNNCRPDGDGIGHTFNSPSNLGTAFSEGWASFFACSAKDTNMYKDTQTDKWFGADFENANYYYLEENPTAILLPPDPKSYSNNAMYELNVGAVLMDLYDSSNEGTDTVTKGFNSVDKLVLSQNNSIYDFYDNWIISEYADGIKEQTWNVFDNRYVAHDMNIPFSAVLNTSESDYSYSGSSSHDDIAIKKYEWVIDRWDIIDVGYGQPGAISFDPDILGLSSGWHTLSLFCYDPEGMKPSTERVRFDDFGVFDYSFYVEYLSLTPTSSQSLINSENLIKAFFEPLLESLSDSEENSEDSVTKEVIEKDTNIQVINHRNINSHLNNLMKSIPDTELTLLSKKDILEYQKSKVYNIDIIEESDLNIYLHVVGPFDRLTVMNPEGVVVKTLENVYPHKAISIENAVIGKWTIEVEPSRLLTEKDEGIPLAIAVTAMPTSILLNIPEAANSNILTIEGDINDEETIQIGINNEEYIITGVNKRFKKQIILKEGINEINSVKSRGNSKSRITKQYIMVDTLPPEIKIFDMVNERASTNKQWYTIDGVVSDDAKMVTVNGKEVCLGERIKGFVTNAELKEGVNSFVIQAIDHMGNISVKEVIIVKE